MNSKFVHLHVHSDNSLLDGYGTIKEYINKAKELNMPALALTDHNTMTGIYQFMAECKMAGIKPIPGVEFNMAPENPHGAYHKEEVIYKEHSRQIIPNRGSNTHLTVLAKNTKGIKNLFKLIEESYSQDRFYNVPRIDLDLLVKYKEGLIVLSGCPNSELNIRLRLEQNEEALSYASRMKAIFGDDFYIELMDWKSIPDYSVKKLALLAKKLEIKTVITNDVHYLEKEDAIHQEHFMAVGSNTKLEETPSYRGGLRPALGGNNREFKSYEEMKSVLNHEESLLNTIEIANKVEEIELEYDSHLRPKVILPDEFDNDLDYFDYIIKEGFRKKRAHQSKEIQKESIKKIKEEREVILSNDFISYFLVVREYLQWSKDNGYPIGVGRGCFLSGNKVTGLRNKLYNIEDIKEGQKIRTHDGSYQKVEKLWKYDIKEKIIELTLSNGKTITSTVDHLIFEKEKGFTETQDLRVGDVLLGAKGSRENTGPYYCIDCNKETLDMPVKEARKQIYKEQPYKKVGEYMCNDCKNKKLHMIPAVKEGLIKAEERAKDPDVRKKNSEGLKKHWATHREERIEKFRNWLNSEESNGYRETKRKQALLKYSDPKHLEILTSLKNKKYKNGKFHSHQQNDKEIYYASSYELKALNILETDSNVKAFDRFKGVIKWTDEFGVERNYLPDFFVEFKDGSTKIIEVKVHWQTKTEEVKLKSKYATEYAKTINSEFEIWTEKELELKNDRRHNEYTITSIRTFDYEGPVYDLKVENVHNYTLSDVTVHNSVGGSEIAYLMDISNTDPIRFDLLFERFISAGRGAIFEIEYEDGTKEQSLVSNKKNVDGVEKYIYQLNVGDEVEDVRE